MSVSTLTFRYCWEPRRARTSAHAVADHVGVIHELAMRQPDVRWFALCVNGEDLPHVRHALELMLTSIRELNPRADHEIDNGARHEHLTRLRQGRDALTDVHRHAGDVRV